MIDAADDMDVSKIILHEILQPTRATEEATDIYKGDNKLIELKMSTFGGTRRKNTTFILSAVSSGFRINLYSVEALISRSYSFTSCSKKYKIRH
jgi:hypothetical protein